jgi:hypothetical protein
MHMTALLWRSVGRLWPWLVAAIGVSIIVAGAVLFWPDAVSASTAPTLAWSG